MDRRGTWADEVERLNRVIAPGLRFRVEPARPRGRVPCTGAAVRMSGVLVMRGGDGRERSAACALDGTARGRSRTLAVAACLAECAMELGLGAQACRWATARRDGSGTETP